MTVRKAAPCLRVAQHRRSGRRPAGQTIKFTERHHRHRLAARRFRSRGSSTTTAGDGQHRRAAAPGRAEEVAGHRRRVHRPRNRQRVRGTRHQSHGGGGARNHPGDGRPRPRSAAGKEAARRVRGDLHRHEGDGPDREAGGYRGRTRRQRRAEGADLRPRAGLRRPATELGEPGVGEDRREGQRARVHPDRQAAPHERKSHLRDWRRWRGTGPGAQGDCGGAGGRGCDPGRAGGVEPAGDPGGDLHRPPRSRGRG